MKNNITPKTISDHTTIYTINVCAFGIVLVFNFITSMFYNGLLRDMLAYIINGAIVCIPNYMLYKKHKNDAKSKIVILMYVLAIALFQIFYYSIHFLS